MATVINKLKPWFAIPKNRIFYTLNEMLHAETCSVGFNKPGLYNNSSRDINWLDKSEFHPMNGVIKEQPMIPSVSPPSWEPITSKPASALGHYKMAAAVKRVAEEWGRQPQQEEVNVFGKVWFLWPSCPQLTWATESVHVSLEGGGVDEQNFNTVWWINPPLRSRLMKDYHL